MQCMGNVIITFFTLFNPTPCDKKLFRTPDPLSAFWKGLGTDYFSVGYIYDNDNSVCVNFSEIIKN